MNAVDHLLKPVDPEEFIRASRGILVNISAITKATPMTGGMFVLSLSNGQELHTSQPVSLAAAKGAPAEAVTEARATRQ